MLSNIQIFYLVAILLSAIAGGFLPLLKPEKVRTSDGFPRGEAFASGVFLALSLLMMLPSSLIVNFAVPSKPAPPIFSFRAATAWVTTSLIFLSSFVGLPVAPLVTGAGCVTFVLWA